jgi:hypothetical protein
MEGRVRFTLKAIQELSTLGLDSSDAIEVLAGLRASTFFERFASRESDEWLYVFKPDIDGMVMYLKLVLRTGCVIVSFHEDGSDE